MQQQWRSLSGLCCAAAGLPSSHRCASQELGRALAGFPAAANPAEGVRADGEGADFVVNTVTDTMHLMREELSLLRRGPLRPSRVASKRLPYLPSVLCTSPA